MEETIRKDLLKILKKTVPAVKKCDEHTLKLLSNQTIHNAGIYQDSDSISIAIIIYAFSKIFKEKNGIDKSCQKLISILISNLNNAIEQLKQKQIIQYRSNIKRLFSNLSKIDKKFGLYITNVINQAKIKKASKIYEHGFSAGTVAELMGISTWELMSYIGKTKITDVAPLMTITPIQRLKNARRMFNLK